MQSIGESRVQANEKQAEGHIGRPHRRLTAKFSIDIQPILTENPEEFGENPERKSRANF
jgi:hypothetical protein